MDGWMDGCPRPLFWRLSMVRPGNLRLRLQPACKGFLPLADTYRDPAQKVPPQCGFVTCVLCPNTVSYLAPNPIFDFLVRSTKYGVSKSWIFVRSLNNSDCQHPKHLTTDLMNTCCRYSNICKMKRKTDTWPCTITARL